MFLLNQAQQVGGVADLGLDFLLAVPEVIVRDHGDNHPAFVAGAHLERASTVVEFLRVLPAHTVAALARRRVVVVGEAEFPFGQFRQVRGQDHRARVSRPAPGFQGGVVVRQVGIAPVAENALHEVKVRHQRARREETHLQAAFPRETRDVGNHHGTQQHGHPRLGGGLVARAVGQDHQVRRRVQGVLQQAPVDFPGNRQFVILHCRAALCDMEDTLGGAAIVQGIVQHPVDQAVTAQVFRGELVSPDGKRQCPGQSGLIQHEGLPGQLRGGSGSLQVGIQECLDAAINRGKPVREPPVQFALPRQYRAHQIGPLGVVDGLRNP